MTADPCMSPGAEWFEDAEGNLYIVPPLDETMENIGPDGATMDALNAICRGGRMPDEQDGKRLGLAYVHAFLRRRNGEEGYYHA